MPENTVFSYLTSEGDDQLFDPDHKLWAAAETVTIDRYWNGRAALKERNPAWRNLTQAASVWSPEAVYFYFQCWYDQLNVRQDWSRETPVPGLWDKDVVEVLLRPESRDDYFEIEISPLGQWLDVHVMKPRLDVDYAWDAKPRLSVRIDEQSQVWRAFLALPFEPLTEDGSSWKAPETGDAWRLNLCRLAGVSPNREYLAWCPTFTALPDFHVPAAFGNIIFVGD